MNEWNIQSRAHACTACEQPFADKQNYHTVLLDEHTEFRRQDLCDACWQKDFGDAVRERKGYVSHWLGTYEAPPPVAEVIQKENAEGLLRKIIAANDPRYAPAAYILAVMLERKRLLRVKEQLQREGQRVFIYEQPKSGDVFTIVDPALQLNQLEQVQRDVADLLEHGFTPAEPIPTPGAATEPLPPTVPQVEPDTAIAATDTPPTGPTTPA